MIRHSTTIMLGAGLLMACNSLGSNGSTPWWAAGTTASDTGNATVDDDGDDEEDDDGEEGFEGPEKLFWMALTLGEGGPTGGYGGIWWIEESGIRCDLEYSLTAVGPAEGCASCTWAVRLDVGEPEVHDDDGSCASEPLASLGGQVIEIGQDSSGSVLWRDGSEWTARGESEQDPPEWFFEMDLS